MHSRIDIARTVSEHTLQYSVLAKGNSGGALPYSWARGHANHPGMFLKNMRSTEMGFPFFLSQLCPLTNQYQCQHTTILASKRHTLDWLQLYVSHYKIRTKKAAI